MLLENFKLRIYFIIICIDSSIQASLLLLKAQNQEIRAWTAQNAKWSIIFARISSCSSLRCCQGDLEQRFLVKSQFAVLCTFSVSFIFIKIGVKSLIDLFQRILLTFDAFFSMFNVNWLWAKATCIVYSIPAS